MYLRQHNLLFIHIPKTGGQSIASYLMGLNGYEWQDRWLFGMVRNESPRLGPPQVAHFTLNEYFTSIMWPYEAIKDSIKVCVVRNPWDRLWSEYNFHWKNICSWDEFCRKFPAEMVDNYETGVDYSRHIKPQVDFLDDRVEVLRFENLAEDFKNFCVKFDIPGTHELEFVNKGGSVHYTEVYDEEKKAIVANFYAQDISAFGYKFGE